jgi:hypothetical protein
MNIPTIINYQVFNPNFASDVIKFLRLEGSHQQVLDRIIEVNNANPLSTEQIEAGVLNLREKLEAFIDRLEFIGHLDLVSRYVQQEKFILMGQEVQGLHWDINSLRLYLALTCVDIFVDTEQHRDYFERLLCNTSTELQDIIMHNVKVPDSTQNIPDTLQKIGLYLYSIRNYYTHAGKRFHLFTPQNKDIAQIQKFPVGSLKHKQLTDINLAPGFNLTDFILEVVKYDVKRRFNWT